MNAAAALLAPGGWLKVVLPPARLGDLRDALQCARSARGEALTLRVVRSMLPAPGEPAWLVEAAACMGAARRAAALSDAAEAPVEERPPVHVRNAPGGATARARALR